MTNIFEIAKGKYDLNPAMQIEIANTIEVLAGKSYSITGENGSGKSSFVRNILYQTMTKFCKGNIQYLYFDQEIISQFYFGQAYFSITENKPIKNIDEFIITISKLHADKPQYSNRKMILILDETDKYVKTTELLSIFKDYEVTYFIVSHYRENSLTYDYNIKIKSQNPELSTLEI